MALAMSAGSGRVGKRVHAHDLVHIALAGLDLGAQRRRHHVGRPNAVHADAVRPSSTDSSCVSRSIAALPML